MTNAGGHNDRVVDQFTRQAEGYRRYTTSLGTDRSTALRAMVGAQTTDHLLDVCCGPAAMAIDLAPHVAHATGLDLTPAMLEQGRIVQAERGIANIDWALGDIYAMPFADARFSIVLCGAAFHHLLDPACAFAEMVRVCRPGGRIVVRDVTPAADKSAQYDRIEMLRDPSHNHALSPEELHALGDGLPVTAPVIDTHITADLSFDAILGASHPETCTREDLAALMRADAEKGEDQLGFSARVIDGEVRVSYPMSTAMWTRR